MPRSRRRFTHREQQSKELEARKALIQRALGEEPPLNLAGTHTVQEAVQWLEARPEGPLCIYHRSADGKVSISVHVERVALRLEREGILQTRADFASWFDEAVHTLIDREPVNA